VGLVRVLIVSNIDSREPFGQFTRPFFLGRAMAEEGVEVANVGIECSRIDFGAAWSTGQKSLRRLARVTTLARSRFAPDVIYAHQNLPGTAALLAARGTPVVADFHSLPSVEWAGLLRGARASEAPSFAAAAARASGSERVIAARANGIVAAGENLAREIGRRYRPRAVPVTVVNGVDPRLLAATRSPASPIPTDLARHSAVATLPSSASPSNRRALAFLAHAARGLENAPLPVAVHVLGSAAGPTAPLLRYHGLQPDLVPWLDHADVCLLPYPAEASLFGGAKNKLLEYLARARAVVSTTEGLRGLEAVADWRGVEVVSDDPGDFARAVARAVRPEAPKLEDERAAVHRELRWDALARKAADALSATISNGSS